MLAPEAERAAFLNWMCERLGMPWTDNSRCSIDLWRRVPHPQKPTAPGPELDVFIDGDRVVVIVEAKWRSRESRNQGLTGTATQMQLRREFFDRWGEALYPGRGMLLLSVVVRDALTAAIDPDDSGTATSSITWDELAQYERHPNGAEFARYLAWKRAHSLGPGRA